jgi:excisionase family DNA binding protein
MSITDNLLAAFLTPDEAAVELKVCKRTLDRWEALHEGPPRTYVGRKVLYRRSSLEAWLHARERRGSVS